MNTELAKLNLFDAKLVLDKLGVPFFLSNGTLLGCYRDGKMIEHDTDIDIGIKVKDYVSDILYRFLENGFELSSIHGNISNGLEYSFRKRGMGLDIFFYQDSGDNSWMAVWQERSNKRFRYIFPLIKDYKVINFLGQDFKIPSNVEEYLESQYGNWRVPVKHWDCFVSPDNVETNYWQWFYKIPRTFEPSEFARSLNLHDKSILDLGCGNGRDTLYFAKDNNVTGIDMYAPMIGPFQKISIENFIEKEYKADVLYCRFLFHVISDELEEKILKWGKCNMKNVYIECRSDKGIVPDHSHDRRLINLEKLLGRCFLLNYFIEYFEENTGLAKTDTEDPVIIRLHLKS